ncbi:hypothetical protein [Paenibacillus koleovorans]|uniref:hypothetical protein n=1 Tax=Paenibacillus koleovorans TaxID=121608 RepID=UPI000FDC3C3D|nr:hypothetical protein [Paenibacillus koleovorans]
MDKYTILIIEDEAAIADPDILAVAPTGKVVAVVQAVNLTLSLGIVSMVEQAETTVTALPAEQLRSFQLAVSDTVSALAVADNGLSLGVVK